MIYFLFTTAQCNLTCMYCGGTPEDLCMPVKPTYHVSNLETFIAEDPEPYFVFYGGEPLMNLAYCMSVMDHFGD
ncbi:hypothetical protein KIPB_013412, partial [Kipferlia bialata]|eukprot:g13412.t1